MEPATKKCIRNLIKIYEAGLHKMNQVAGKEMNPAWLRISSQILEKKI
jgi:hypothetical protein